MTLEIFRDFCLQLPGTTEHLPFDDKTLVFKVQNKMFALTDLEEFTFVNLKNLPEINLELRERHDAIKEGYHMNKAHWNSVYVDRDVDDSKILELTQQSYNLIVNSLSKKLRDELAHR